MKRNTLGNLIDSHRIKKGWTIQELALQSNISTKSINNIINDKVVPTLKTLGTLSVVLESNFFSDIYMYLPNDAGLAYLLSKRADELARTKRQRELEEHLSQINSILPKIESYGPSVILHKTLEFHKGVAFFYAGRYLQAISTWKNIFDRDSNLKAPDYSNGVMDSKILMNIYLAKYMNSAIDEALRGLTSKALVKNRDEDLRCALLFNTCFLYQEAAQYSKSLELAIEGANFSMTNGRSDYTDRFLYQKGMAEFYLGRPYENSFTMMYSLKALDFISESHPIMVRKVKEEVGMDLQHIFGS